MNYRYTFQNYDEKKMAKAVGRSLPISPKQAREICQFLKNRSLDSAKNRINRVLEMKQAVPFKRFNMDVGHKPGIAAGRYPLNAVKEIAKIIYSAEANANSKGLSDLFIVHMNAHRAPSGARAGRVPGESKRAHVEVVIEQRKIQPKEKRGKKK